MKRKKNLFKAIQNEQQKSNIKENQNKIVQKLNNHYFKRQVFSVYNNPEFAAEFAQMISEIKDELEILLIDSDALCSKISQVLGLKNTINEEIISYNDEIRSSFNMAMDYVSKNNVTKEFFKKICVKQKDNFYILTGNDKLELYEYYSSSSFEKVYNLAIDTFDIVIINTNSNIYDEFLVKSFYYCDFILFPIDANITEIGIINRLIKFLEDKQNIDIKKSKFIGFNYLEDIHLEKELLETITDDNYLGNISFDKKRLQFRNKIHKSYYENMPQAIKEEYKNILRSFDILPDINMIEKIKLKLDYKKNSKKLQKLR